MDYFDVFSKETDALIYSCCFGGEYDVAKLVYHMDPNIDDDRVLVYLSTDIRNMFRVKSSLYQQIFMDNPTVQNPQLPAQRQYWTRRIFVNENEKFEYGFCKAHLALTNMAYKQRVLKEFKCIRKVANCDANLATVNTAMNTTMNESNESS